MDETSGISVRQQAFDQRIMDTSDTVVIASIVVGGVVTIVLIGVFTYMYTRTKVVSYIKGRQQGVSSLGTPPKSNGIDANQSANISALQLNQSHAMNSEGNIEMSIYDSKHKAIDQSAVNIQDVAVDSEDKIEHSNQVEFWPK